MGSILSGFDTDTLTGAIPWDRFAYGILESPSNVAFVTAAAAAGEPEAAGSGHLFGRDAELRWRRLRNGHYRVVCIDDSGRALDGSRPPARLHLLGEGQLALWGRPSGAEWYEMRVPRRIVEYPADLAGRRVCVRTRRYRLDPGDGPDEPSRYLERWVELLGVEEREAGE